MSPGEFNGKNFGGLHTGIGKYQKGGVYSANGQRFQKTPNRKFTEGKEVSYVGTHKDFIRCSGKIIDKKNDTIRSSRSTIKIELNDGRKTYFHKDSLRFI
jgi:hypothetical protein